MNRWADKSVESMYDKTLLALEISAIKGYIPKGSAILDAGCGEGEGTVEYADRGFVDAFDRSPERLEMALERAKGRVRFFQHDVLAPPLVNSYDVVISQRLLINLGSWENQQYALRKLAGMAKRLIVSEGSIDGVEELNKVRAVYGLEPIPVPAHNVFIRDDDLVEFVKSLGLRWIASGNLGTYYLLTRGVQPALKDKFHWDSPFNRASAQQDIAGAERYARVKVWVFDR